MGVMKVLIVENDPMMIRQLGLMLQHQGFDVLTVTNPREALLVFDAQRPDAVVLNLDLPEEFGPKLCRVLRSRRSVPTLLMTRDAMMEAVECVQAGEAEAYVLKPFSLATLFARLRAMLLQERAVQSPLQPQRHVPAPA